MDSWVDSCVFHTNVLRTGNVWIKVVFFSVFQLTFFFFQNATLPIWLNREWCLQDIRDPQNHGVTIEGNFCLSCVGSVFIWCRSTKHNSGLFEALNLFLHLDGMTLQRSIVSYSATATAVAAQWLFSWQLLDELRQGRIPRLLAW